MGKLLVDIVHSKAAGIDVGSRFHMVAVNQNAEEVKRFGVYTEDHQSMIVWLRNHEVTTIAMESTGSYWQTLFSALQTAGFEVLLVNGRQTQSTKGKKTDVQDCMEIQKRHSLGMLSGSFLPTEYTEQLRTYYNHRQHLIEQMSKYTNKLQKAFRLMNIRLDVALNDITGKSGTAIAKAILAGERNPQVLAGLVDRRVKKTQEEIASSLQGNWREDLLFEAKECLALYELYQSKLIQCDQQLNKVLELMQSHKEVKLPSLSIPKQRTKHSPLFDVRTLAFARYGVDLFAIPAISYHTVLCFVTHLGKEEFEKFPTAKNFTSWMRLASNNKITGGKIISRRTPKGKNPIALALRQAANSIGNMKEHPLLSFFKRIAYRKGRGAAITATARKLGVIIYNMITRQQPYQPMDSQKVIEKIKTQQIKNIKQRLFKLNLTQDELKNIFTMTSIPASY